MRTQAISRGLFLAVKPQNSEPETTAIAYASTLKKPRKIGEPAASYLPFAGTISEEDGVLMLATIEESCGKAFPHEDLALLRTHLHLVMDVRQVQVGLSDG